MSDLSQQVEAVLASMAESQRLLAALVRELTAARNDDDEWTRLPAPSARCHVSGFSRSKVLRLIASGTIRTKTVSGGRFYSAADMRKFLSQVLALN